MLKAFLILVVELVVAKGIDTREKPFLSQRRS
jgi:hypothetical protein